MDTEEQDDGMEAILSRKRHKETMRLLNHVATNSESKEPGDSGLKAAIAEHTKALQGIADALKNQPKPEKAEAPKITVNNDELAKHVKDLHDRISSHLDDVKKYMEPKEYQHTVERNEAGFIKKINSKQK